ncbi:hypothetical protein PCANC_22193, partial [Puccinia coronata f. sp. avenae]
MSISSPWKRTCTFFVLRFRSPLSPGDMRILICTFDRQVIIFGSLTIAYSNQALNHFWLRLPEPE